MTFTRLAFAALAAAVYAGAAAAQSAADSAEVRHVCAADFERACPNAKPGNGSLKTCARAHFMSFSRPCKRELRAVRARMRERDQNNAAD